MKQPEKNPIEKQIIMGRGRQTQKKEKIVSLVDQSPEEDELFDDFGDSPASCQGNARLPIGFQKMNRDDFVREKVHSIKKNGLLPLTEEDRKVSQTEKVAQPQKKRRGRPRLNKPKKERREGHQYRGGRAKLPYRRIYDTQKLRAASHAKIRTILKNLTILHKISGRGFKFETITPRGDTIVYHSPNAASEFQSTVDRAISTGKGHVTVITTRDCEKRFRGKKGFHIDEEDPDHPMHSDPYNFSTASIQRNVDVVSSGPLHLPDQDGEGISEIMESIFSGDNESEDDSDSDDDFSDNEE